MKRSTPLTRRTPLRQASSLLRRTPLRAVSSRARARNATRRTVLQQLVDERGPFCQVGWDEGCQRIATDGHEPWTRARGGDATDPAQIVLCCRYCHDAIHANPNTAVLLGWLRHSWDKAPVQ